ncbi:hypothetical protein DFH08DRAFT_811584 [Mycena albidolilacea]|uniref:Uncharacterized protein n=1 Tax=Mycena albidolilacea TaxID=1033008 RepID=A0AAD7EPW7_9AGAR|nr:hypothetical protein DFH08DRAFT_811584 [Mycena albidolilacea]
MEGLKLGSKWTGPKPAKGMRNLPPKWDKQKLWMVPASELCFIYYYEYTPDGVLRCKNPLKGNPFIDRLKATSVPLPHTVASLKQVIVQPEGLPDPTGDFTSLFKTRNTWNAMVSSTHVDILTGDLGATIKTPMVLVFITNPTPLLPVVSEDEVGDHLGNKLPPHELIFTLLSANELSAHAGISILSAVQPWW